MNLINLRGRVAYVFNEDNFDVDLIVGVGNIRLKDEDEMVRVAMNAYDRSFASSVKPGDLLVGGANFGYGHPHYPPMIAMRKLGIAGVIAETFYPGYWLGEIAEGFPQVGCPGITDLVERWDEIEVDWEQTRVVNHTKNLALPFEPLNQSAMQLLDAGGLIPFLKQSNC